MQSIIKWARSIPVLDGFISFGARLGLWGFLWNIGAVIWSLAVTIWAGVASHVPGWGLALIFTLTAAISIWMVSKGMAAYRDFTVARAMNKFDPAQHKAFGAELIQLSSDIFRFLADRQRDHSDLHKANPANGPAYQDWQADRDFEQVTGKLFFEKFGTRVLGSVALLHRMGIKMPHHMMATAHYRPSGLPQFLGMMGDLLSRGNIEDAASAANDRDLMWQIGH
jgi:hypothetical protein